VSESDDTVRKHEEANRRRAERQRQERATDQTGNALTDRERGEVEEHRRLSSVTVYSILQAEGEEELTRPVNSLWWSGIAAGIGISTSLLAEGILYHHFDGHPRRELIAQAGYSVGFVLVIVSRLQLFTENTISVILPLLADPGLGKLGRTARLWSVVLLANLVGTFVTAFITLTLQTTTPDHLAAMLELARVSVETHGWRALHMGIPAGFYVAALVWLLPSSKGFEIFVIIMISWLIAAGGFTHVVAGSAKVFLLVGNGELSLLEGLVQNLLPTLIGNILGGTGLFALLAYAQVREEI
jgi:formate/nitrite transporter FocA (FNT family)